MERIAKICLMVIGLAVISSWTILQIKSLEKAEWLIGTWENKSPRGSIYESWSQVGPSEFTGMSYVINGSDTMVFETIRIIEEKNQVYYIPTVKNQNDGLPVRFELMTISDTEMVFENLQHDFPQRISYSRIMADSLVAEISGLKNGQERKQTFPMKRLKK